MILIANNDVVCYHIIIQSCHHHEDASLALWALLERERMNRYPSFPHHDSASAWGQAFRPLLNGMAVERAMYEASYGGLQL